MGQRTIRVNELIRREISEILHTDYQSETVAITVFEVDVAPDLRHARVYYSVLGDGLQLDDARRFFDKYGGRIRRKVGRRVVLKYLPHLTFYYDPSMERGANTLALLDEIEQNDEDNDSQT